jgi:hypothetical protein
VTPKADLPVRSSTADQRRSLPLHPSPLAGVPYVAIAGIRYEITDSGRTFVESGAEMEDVRQ